jgi:predicted ATP-grasp superfamily ATP-dependent carboligase
MPTALVTDANRGSAIAVIRSLGREGWKVVAADDRHDSLGFLSRYANHHAVYPSPAESAPAFTLALQLLAKAHHVDLIVPITDEAILPLACSRDRFAPSTQLAIADDDALNVVMDKRATLLLAEKQGVPIPRTYVVHSLEEARDFAHMLPWPVVLKARRSRVWQDGRSVARTGGVAYADNVADLARHVERLIPSGSLLVQSYTPGTGEGVEMLAYRGRVLAAFQHRRLAEVPITGGASALRESVALDPQLFAYSRRLVQALEWTGLIMVEFKVGADGPVLMEINGRVWGSLPLAVHSGMDFPARLGDLYLNGPPPADEPPATDYQIGVQACNLDLMALWIGQVLRGRQRFASLSQPPRRAALAAVARLFVPGRKYDVQTLDDPKPGLAQLKQIAAKLGRKAQEAAA